MEDTEMDIILSAVDNASDTFESVQSAAEGMGDTMQESAEQGTDGMEQMEESAQEAVDPLEQITTIIGGLAGAEIFSQLADTLWDFADKAGTFEDSLMRARLEAEGAGISVNDMTDTVSELGRVTGRAGGEIREAFITATARGITDLDSFKQMMIGAGAQATLLGTDIDSMANKMSGLAMRSSVMERTLANTGITVEELGEALGIQGATIDDINDKWATLDTNQRAAALGMAASMNEGKTANEEYKHSWAGLQAQVDIAKGRLERLAGEVLLPVLVPALEVAGRVLNWLGDTISAVMDGPLGGLISVVGALVAGFALLVPAVMAIEGAMALYTASLAPAITATWALLSPWLPFIAIGAAIIAIVYEIGVAFGWWTDVGSMIDAIWAGIQRLWSAFINHPDVQSFLSAMTVAWNWLVPAVTGVVNAVLRFFGVTSSSNFDLVRTLIGALGVAWQALTLPIRTVINVIKLLWTTMKTVYNNIRTTVNNIKKLFSNLPGAIRGAISSIVGILTAPFRTAYSNITGTVNSIKNTIRGITNVNISSVTSKLTAPFTNAYNRIVGIVNSIKAKANSIPVIGGAFGFDYEGMLEAQANGETHSSMDINLNVDLSNVPAHIDTNTLISVLTDPTVLAALTNNNNFQTLDARAKNRLLMKQARAGGI